MKQKLLLLMLSAHVAYGASSSATSGPMQVGTPNKEVATLYTASIKQSVDRATILNGGTPTGDIAAPFKAIAAVGLLQYMKDHPEMIGNSTSYVQQMDNVPAVTTTYEWVEKSTIDPISAQIALDTFYLTANVPLGKMEVKEVPGLNMKIPFMVPVMLLNQELKLSDAQKDMWNAAFTAEASILSAMQKANPEGFTTWAQHILEQVRTPETSRCVLQ